MKHRIPTRQRKPRESGYALLLIMFFLALLVLAMSEAAPTVLSSVQREREKEMVWRGKQYTRGIRMYYMKMKRFPTSMDDLTKPKTGIRFMRQAYRDPMNQVDGTWRLIYVGPNGQLIGSLSNRSLTINGMGAAGVAGMQGSGSLAAGNSLTNTSTGGFGTSSFGSSSFGSNQGGTITSNGMNAGGVASPMAPGAPDTGTGTDDPLQPHSLVGSMDASNTIGGNIIGVGSKINKKSFLIYEHAKNYRQFEFIWDPSKDTTVGQASAGIGTPVQNSTGMTPAGSSGFGSTTSSPFGSGTNPGQSINQPSQNPNPSSPPGGGIPPGGMGSDPSMPLQAPNQ